MKKSTQIKHKRVGILISSISHSSVCMQEILSSSCGSVRTGTLFTKSSPAGTFLSKRITAKNTETAMLFKKLKESHINYYDKR